MAAVTSAVILVLISALKVLRADSCSGEKALIASCWSEAAVMSLGGTEAGCLPDLVPNTIADETDETEIRKKKDNRSI